LPPTSQQPWNAAHWMKLPWGPWKHSIAKKLKNGSIHIQSRHTYYCCEPPASANTSDQPSSISANFLAFTSVLPLWSSDFSSVPSLNLKANAWGGTAKK
jgi:hypothetical protein